MNMTTTKQQARLNADLAIRYWSDPTLKAWFWQTDLRVWRLCAHPDFHTGTTWHVGHEVPTEPPTKMCELAGVKFPMPMTEVPKVGSECWIVFIGSVSARIWRSDDIEMGWFQQRRCHRTKEAAELHWKALSAANMQAVEAAK